jgi:hypothetical protein
LNPFDRIKQKISCMSRKLTFLLAQMTSRELQHEIDLLIQECNYVRAETEKKAGPQTDA